MSRIGKKVIVIPEKTTVVMGDGLVSVKGPLGELSRAFKNDIAVTVGAGQVTLAPKNEESAPLWGTYSAHLSNMIAGVNKLFQKKLIIEGIGFKSEVKGEELVLALGFSHPVKVKIPKGLKITAEKNLLTISGIDTELVGQFSAKIRSLKKPEPYKGKGIRYEKEVIRRKQGKKTT